MAIQPSNGVRISAMTALSGALAVLANSRLEISFPDASAPTGFRTAYLTGAQLTEWLGTVLNADTSVSLTRAQFADLRSDEALGQYLGKQLIITDRVDESSNPLPNVVLLQVLGSYNVSEQQAYTIDYTQQNGYVLTPGTYDPATDTFTEESGDGGISGPQLDIYGATQAKRTQVFSLFTNDTQTQAVDVPLAGDTSTRIGSRIPDLPNGDMYELVPDFDTPDANGNATPTWLRYGA